MFAKKNRYITRGVNERIDLQLQILLWSLVDDLQIEKDYLQVFKLSRVVDVVNIEHTQEVPDYKVYIKVNAKDLEFEGNEKVYLIDSQDYSTMLLSEEY
ncbi:hypothetical protein CSBG_00698 [Clostridium sp. 7_2_43FAA]|uniref:DUF960 family protein n=1 Tax=Clostridium TaxID=1485 RepID=UPI00019AFEFB|nr:MULTISPECIES: DUF960 family protein [Clostridium]EEH97072.1 hypothetical protein CSBG_00698 [Clostridium sp. 7_2_43FAA]MDU7241241.1 DUF960 family protein [Clostridium sp.]